MKKLATMAIIGLTLLAGCGTRTIVVEKAADTTIEIPQESEYAQQEANRGPDALIANVIANYPHLINNLGKPWVLDFTRAICTEIDSGTTVTDFVQMSTRYDIDAEMMGFLIGEAVRNLCPANQWFIDAALSA